MVANHGESDDGPDGGVGVLATVFADAGDVAFDIAGVERRFVERGSEELDEAAVAADEALIDGVHGVARARWIACAGNHGPALRERRFGILRFRSSREVCRRRTRRVGPIAVPGIFLDVVVKAFGFFQAFRAKASS